MWKQKLHLEPPDGWLNDPNGLSWFKGKYHVYFQYAPDNADGSGKKCWGHYESADLIKWTFTGTVLLPDSADDRSGVYSGSAYPTGEKLEIFYTGNVKLQGDFDYVAEGRQANVIHVSSSDGHEMSAKKTVLRNSDYPDFCSCHVRDPKIWREGQKWRMVLGARTLDDTGCVLFYSSDDLDNWIYDGYDSVSNFGYMWECPDCFEIDGHRFLSISPQGLTHETMRYQNVYQSGYFKYDDKLSDFNEWDCGFDFYAPQTFDVPDGRKLLIGWMGIGDIPYSNPTVMLGWQHCLTIPREIELDENNEIVQHPVREINTLRGEKTTISLSDKISLPFDLCAKTDGNFMISLDGVKLYYENRVFSLEFTDKEISGGRTKRQTQLDKCGDIRVIADMSSLEIYLDGGRKVFSTRYYPKNKIVTVSINGIYVDVYKIDGMEVIYND